MENIGITTEMEYQIKKGLARQYWEYELNRLAELEEKIKNSTLVELPCKVGDALYYIDDWCVEHNKIEEHCIEEIRLVKGEIRLCIYDNVYLSANNLGDCCFLTREEAEDRLEELKR